MNFIINRGTPQFPGHYVCYLPGVEAPTVIRIWIPGTGWTDHLRAPLAGKVAGWIGPLPIMPKTSIAPEYDL